MRRTILIALLLSPSLAMAMPVRANSEAQVPMPSSGLQQIEIHQLMRDTQEGSIGNGQSNLNDQGHPTGPGTTQVDTASTGPINDVQPGRGSTDTRQNRNPPPAY